MTNGRGRTSCRSAEPGVPATADRPGNGAIELRRLIRTARLRPGRKIVQVSLAALLCVGRVPLGEALKMSKGQGPLTYPARQQIIWVPARGCSSRPSR
jgi:DNA-binding GntR family transcriptional regulator